MSGNDKNRSVYSASDIQKYLSGELSAPEMHRLELAALEDPFLSDALEGMEIHRSLPSSPTLQQDLGELQERLNKRVGEKDRTGILPLLRSPWKAAAVLILLLGTGLTAYFTFLNTASPKNSLAKAIARSVPPPAAPVDSLVPDARTTTPGGAADKATEITRPSGKKETAASNAPSTTSRSAVPDKASLKRNMDKAIPANSFKRDSVSIQKNTLQLTDKYAALDKKINAVPGSRVPTANPDPFGSLLNGRQEGLKITDPAEPFVFTGRVTDQYNHPLPGASLHLKDNYSLGTVTDKNGDFKLTLPQRDSASRLTVAYVGYEEASLGLNTENRTGNIIQLQPRANAMNEVVVVGYGANRKEIIKDNSEPLKKSNSKRAVPTEGWPAYQSYLDLHKKAINPDSTLKGDVIISFFVNKEGGLSSFKVEKSLSPAHDSAAIRLVREGPAASWKLLRGKKARAWVTISF